MIDSQLFSRVSIDVVAKVIAAIAFFTLLLLVTSPLIASQAIIFAIFALGYNLLLGYGGQMSFGHAAYYGLGAYGTMLSIQHIHPNLFISMVIGIVVASLAGLILGAISLRRRGVYFSMITLALAMMVYYAVRNLGGDLTGGTTGLGITYMDATIGPFDPVSNPINFFIFTCLALIFTYIILVRIVNSRFGRVLVAIRENEKRATHLGYNSYRLLLLTFVLSGMISGLAGALNVGLTQYITPDVLFWLIGGEVVMVTILGGVGTLAGPVIGAVVYILMSRILPTFLAQWQLLFGLIFVFVVILAPSGIYGLYLKWRTDEGEVNKPVKIYKLIKYLRE